MQVVRHPAHRLRMNTGRHFTKKVLYLMKEVVMAKPAPDCDPNKIKRARAQSCPNLILIRDAFHLNGFKYAT